MVQPKQEQDLIDLVRYPRGFLHIFIVHFAYAKAGMQMKTINSKPTYTSHLDADINSRVGNVKLPVIVEARCGDRCDIGRGDEDTIVGESAEVVFQQPSLWLRRL